MAAAIAPPDHANLLAPILPALPAAAASTQPALPLLPLFSPILRQRVQLLSVSSTEPWLRLLCYDTSKAARLTEIASGPALEPHPVSGEVEVDWGYDAETRYRRVDDETLQALVVLSELGIAFRLVHCANDNQAQPESSSSGVPDIKAPANGWRIGEVTVAEGQSSPFADFGGGATIEEAESQFRHGKSGKGKEELRATNGADAEDDDDDYWARYDATPARTPAQNHSPAPGHGNSSLRNAVAAPGGDGGRYQDTSAEDDYYAQYDSVQPAMDNHDPDEEQAAQEAQIIPPLGFGQAAQRHEQPQPRLPMNNGTAAFAPFNEASNGDGVAHGEAGQLLHPRPDSSASSSGSQAVAKLEETAGRREQSEFGVRQHISRSVRSLFLLSRSGGIDRDEFESLVRSELDVLGMMDSQE